MVQIQTLTAQARRGVRSSIRAVRSNNPLLSRYVINAAPVVSYRRQTPTLTSEATRVAAALATSGVVLTTAIDLLGDDALLGALQDQAASLRTRPDLEVDPAKPFLTELLGSAPAVGPADPLVAFALHPSVRGVAERYCGMNLKVQDVNIWINRPVDSGPSQSQRWHRDLPEDVDIVKCFVYLSDVQDGAGPLQYVAGSNTPDGRKVRLASDFDGIGHRLSDTDVRAAFGADSLVTARGDAGTVVFADTRGVHRGGFARDAERVVAQITFASKACSRPRTLRPAPGVDRRDLQDLRLVR